MFTRFYCQDIRAYDILFGDVPQPAQAEDLYEILNSFTEQYENEGQRINLRKAAREQKKVLSKGFLFVSVSLRRFSLRSHYLWCQAPIDILSFPNNFFM